MAINTGPSSNTLITKYEEACCPEIVIALKWHTCTNRAAKSMMLLLQYAALVGCAHCKDCSLKCPKEGTIIDSI